MSKQCEKQKFFARLMLCLTAAGFALAAALPAGAARLTVDKNVRSRLYPELRSLYSNRDMRFLIPGYFIFEVKFYLHLPRWVRDVVRRFDLQRQAFSKYSTGIEIHRVDQKHLRGAGHTVEFPDVVPLRAGAFA